MVKPREEVLKFERSKVLKLKTELRRAERPERAAHISVGQRPTIWRHEAIKAESLVHKQAPKCARLSALIILFHANVGRCPTLVYSRLSALGLRRLQQSLEISPFGSAGEVLKFERSKVLKLKTELRRAESPERAAHTSVGQRPTFWRHEAIKAESLVHKQAPKCARPTALIILFHANVGRCPTLVCIALSGRNPVEKPLKTTCLGVRLVRMGRCPTLVYSRLSALGLRRLQQSLEISPFGSAGEVLTFGRADGLKLLMVLSPPRCRCSWCCCSRMARARMRMPLRSRPTPRRQASRSA